MKVDYIAGCLALLLALVVGFTLGFVIAHDTRRPMHTPEPPRVLQRCDNPACCCDNCKCGKDCDCGPPRPMPRK